MFGIGGGELIFILFIALMLFGSDKIPTIARNLGKIVAQVKNATNDIKHEITKSADESGFDKSLRDITSNFNTQIDDVKKSINNSIENPIKNPLEKVKEDIESISGPVKRQM